MDDYDYNYYATMPLQPLYSTTEEPHEPTTEKPHDPITEKPLDPQQPHNPNHYHFQYKNVS